MGIKDWISNAKPPMPEVDFDRPLDDRDKARFLEPENEYLRAQMLRYETALKLCDAALKTVTEALKGTNEWPQKHLNCDGEPVTGGHIYRAVTAAAEALAEPGILP